MLENEYNSKTAKVFNATVIASSYSYKGLYCSEDNGHTWKKMVS